MTTLTKPLRRLLPERLVITLTPLPDNTIIEMRPKGARSGISITANGLWLILAKKQAEVLVAARGKQGS